MTVSRTGLWLFAAATVLASSCHAQTAAPRAEEPKDDLAKVQQRVLKAVQDGRTIESKLPRVDVTHPDFGKGCPNPADPEGRADSTCAVRNAIQFAQTHPVEGGGYPELYFPHGRYLVAGSGYTAAMTLTASVGLLGDGAQSTTILNTSPSAGTVAYNNAMDCAHKPGPCFLKIEGITFAGNGHKSMGVLIEINNTNTGLMRDVVLAEDGGIALNLQGSSERWIFSQIETYHVRWAVLTEGDTNENYFDRVNVINTGQDESHFCFCVNCPGGKLIQGGAWMPDPHSAVFLDGDNLHWFNSSIKSTDIMGGLRLAPVTSSVSHTYFEGYPWGNQPRTNHAIALGGKLELGHLTQRITASDLLIPVDDAGWQPLYVNDPALVRINGLHSYTPTYFLYPEDYVVGSKDPSSAVQGITRGTFEKIQVASFAGDGNAHVLARGQGNTRAIAWPAGSVIEQIAPNGYGVAQVDANHMNSLVNSAKPPYTSGCDDTAQLPRWTSNPSRLCAEVILGLVPDGYGVPFPPQHYVAQGVSMELANNSVFDNENEQAGEGWIKIAGNGNLNLDEGAGPMRTFTPADTALTTYINGITRLQVVKWGNTPALAIVHDEGGNVEFSSQGKYFSADVNINGSLSHEYLGEQCWYAMQPGTQQPTSRFCVRAGGPAQENLVNGRWTAAGK